MSTLIRAHLRALVALRPIANCSESPPTPASNGSSRSRTTSRPHHAIYGHLDSRVADHRGISYTCRQHLHMAYLDLSAVCLTVRRARYCTSSAPQNPCHSPSPSRLISAHRRSGSSPPTLRPHCLQLWVPIPGHALTFASMLSTWRSDTSHSTSSCCYRVAVAASMCDRKRSLCHKCQNHRPYQAITVFSLWQWNRGMRPSRGGPGPSCARWQLFTAH